MIKQRRRKSKRMAEINVVPYIDVMLVLLVIFMVTAPLLTQGVKVNLPQVAARSIKPENHKPLIVTIDQKGRLFFSGATQPKQALSETALRTELLAQHKQNPQQPMYLQGDKSVPYGRVANIMVILQSAGIDNIGLITETPEKRT